LQRKQKWAVMARGAGRLAFDEQTMKKQGNPISDQNSYSPIPLPVEIASLWRRDPGFVWLDSSTEHETGLSLLGHHPDLILEGESGEWHRLEAELQRRQNHSPRHAPDLGMPHGAAVGYFRFDGSFRFGFYDKPLLHASEGWLGDSPSIPEEPPPKYTPIATQSKPAFKPEMDREQYIGMVSRAQEYVAAGDIYQVCLAHRFAACFAADPWPLYLALREASPAPHAAYLQLGGETVLSSSPECFLKISGRRILTRPIKGTRPRRRDPGEDEHQAFELKTSPKEIAELVMITDLERNDLGSICEYGSVTATQLLHLERYAQVFHLVSTVEGELLPGISQVAAVAACFPGGSVSGAPKKRALEIIRELEPVPRGLFTGAIGYFGYNGESQFNIAIRTVLIRGGRAEFHVGAGITADSDPNKEWEETLHKAAGILQAAREGKDFQGYSGIPMGI
jgi:aminodeoxychorismate synthase component I